jgi:thiol-disulfide isomerase/thioredoxin
MVGGIIGARLLGTGGLGAEEVRLVPWNGAAAPPLSLADYRGQVVILDFWATWCDYCKDEIASIRKLRDQLAGRPLTVLWVNYGQSPARVREYVKGLPADVRVLLDTDQTAARAWSVRLIPSSFLIDGKGRVRYHVIGNLDWSGADAVRTVRALLP